MENNFLSTTVFLPVKSVKETAKFYKDKLGFKIMGIWEIKENNSFYGSVKRGNVVIDFGEGKIENAGTGVCIIHVDNANDIYHELESKDIEFVGNFQDRDYGNKDFRIKDNNGNLLIIGHSLKNQEELLRKNKIL